MSRFHLLPSPRSFFASSLLILSLAMCVPALQSTAAAQAPAAKPSPDVLIFTNGDQLTGTLVRGVSDSIVFKSEMAGEITVPLSKVQELRSSSKFAVLRKNAPITRTPRLAGTIQVGDGKITGYNGTPPTIPDKEPPQTT